MQCLLPHLVEKSAQKYLVGVLTLQHNCSTSLVKMHAVILPNQHCMAQLIFISVQHQSFYFVIL